MLAHNAHEVSVALEVHGEEMERAVLAAADRLAQETARKMRELAATRSDGKKPAGQSTLLDSIKVVRLDGGMAWQIGTDVAHAAVHEFGRKPGKFLPRFDEPEAQSIKVWLRNTAFMAVDKPVRMNSKLGRSIEKALRDRYGALGHHAKKHGLMAHPFFTPAAEELARTAPERLQAVVQRMVAQANGGGASA